MSTAVSSSPPANAARVHAAWLVPLLVLACEYLALAVTFDAADYLVHVGLADVLRPTLRFTGPMLLVCAAATVLVGGKALRAEFEALLGEAQLSRAERTRYAVLHALALAAVIALAYFIFIPPYPRAGSPWLLLTAFIALGVGTVLLLLRAGAPLAVFRRWLSRSWRHCALGVALGVAAWGAGLASEQLWQAVASLTLQTVATATALVIDPTYLDIEARVLATDHFAVEVTAACSGYQGLGLITVFMAGYLVQSRSLLRFPAALWLLPIGLLAILGANIARLTALMAIGHYVSPRIAVNGFHANSGWVLFCLIGLSLVGWSSNSAWLRRDVTTAVSAERASQATPFLAPQLGVLAVAMLTGLLVVDVDYLYALRVLCGALLLYRFRGAYAGLRWSGHWEPLALAALTTAIWLLLAAPWQAGAPSDEALRVAELTPAWKALWIGTRLLGSVLVIPVVEELAFRGYLLRRLQARAFEEVPYARFDWKAFTLSSLAFGLMHQSWIAGTAAGMLFAVAQWRHGRIGDAVVAHGLTNLALSLCVLVFGWWSLW